MNKITKTLISLVVLTSCGRQKIEVKTIRSNQQPVAENLTLQEVVSRVAPIYGVDPKLMLAVMDLESWGGKMDAIAYEPNAEKYAKLITEDPYQFKMYSSSHCAMQIGGWKAKLDYNVNWKELYNKNTCIELGAAILAKCQARSRDIVKIGKCWNGALAYGVKLAKAYKARRSL